MVKKASGTSKTKNCSKGYACGSACINVKKNCRNGIEGQGKNYADWLSKNVGSLTDAQKEAFVSRFKTLAKSPNGLPESLRSQLRSGAAAGVGLPEGVELRQVGSKSRGYSFEFEGSNVNMIAIQGGNGKISISFEVDGDFNVDSDKFTKEQESAIASRLARIMRWEAATAPEGSEYTTSAWQFDGEALATRRAIAYAAMGFSAPQTGFPGSSQEGLIRDGRLQPRASLGRREAEIWRNISTNPLIREESRKGTESILDYRDISSSNPTAQFDNENGETVVIRLLPDEWWSN